MLIRNIVSDKSVEQVDHMVCRPPARSKYGGQGGVAALRSCPAMCCAVVNKLRRNKLGQASLVNAMA
jgi:hypothetical protein